MIIIFFFYEDYEWLESFGFRYRRRYVLRMIKDNDNSEEDRWWWRLSTTFIDLNDY